MDGLLSVHSEEHSSVIVASVFSLVVRNFLPDRRLAAADFAGILTSIFAIAFNFIVLLNKEERVTVIKKSIAQINENERGNS